MHIHIDQGVNISKLVTKILKFKSWENYFWRTLVAFWPTVRSAKSSSLNAKKYIID